MTPEAAKDQINGALNKYLEGQLTRVSLDTVITETISELQDSAFEAGKAVAEDLYEEIDDDDFDYPSLDDDGEPIQ